MDKVLDIVSLAVPDRMSCLHLALELDVSNEVLGKVERTADTDYDTEVCHNMLFRWWASQSLEDPSLLLHALNVCNLTAITEECWAVLPVDGEM